MSCKRVFTSTDVARMDVRRGSIQLHRTGLARRTYGIQTTEARGPTLSLTWLFLHVHHLSSASGGAFQFPLRGAEDDPSSIGP